MSKIETGRFSDLLRRGLGMKGVTEVAAELSPEVSPTWEIEGTTEDWDFLKGKKNCIATALVAAGVDKSTARLRNPAGSGVLAVLMKLVWNQSVVGSQVVFYGTSGFDLSTGGGTLVRDHRWQSVSATVRAALLFSIDATGDATDGQVIHRIRVTENTETALPAQLVLSPGDSVDVQSDTVAVNLRVTFVWSERPVQALEL